MLEEQRFEQIDVAVIVVLWALRFVDLWLRNLFMYTSKIIFGDFMDSEYFTRYEVNLLFAKCALATVVGFIVDAYNHKYFVAFGGMVLFTLTPVMALCMCISEKRIFSLLTLTVTAVVFVTSPAVFGMIFHQKPCPVRVQVRRLVSLMEFAEGSLLAVLEETTSSETDPNKKYGVIAAWVVVIPFLVFVLTILERIRKHANPERLQERGTIAIFKGISKDIAGKGSKTGLSKINVLCFMLLLIPAFSITSLGSVVSNLKPANDTQFQHPLLKHVITVGELTVIPFAEVVLSFVPISPSLAEMLVLGGAHILNIVVLTLLVVRMEGQGGGRSVISNVYEEYQTHPHLRNSSSTESSSVNDEDGGLSKLIRVVRQRPPVLPTVLPPGEMRYVYYIINPTGFLIELHDDPEDRLFDSGEPTILARYRGMVYDDKEITAKEETITITGNPDKTPPPPFSKTVTFQKNKIYFLIVTGNASKLDMVIAGDDVEIPEIVMKPILIAQNTFVGGVYWGKLLTHDHELQIATDAGSVLFIDNLPDRTKSLSVPVPPGQLKLTVTYQGRDPIIKQKLKGPYSENVTIDPATVNMITINVDELKEVYRFGYFVKIHEKRPPPTTKPPPEPETPDAVMQTTYAMFGMSIGLTSVGYTHFFWMGCPIRMRATIYAWFIASNEILGWVAAEVVGDDIGFTEGIGLLIIAIITAIWHFALVWYLDAKEPAEYAKRKRSSAAVRED